MDEEQLLVTAPTQKAGFCVPKTVLWVTNISFSNQPNKKTLRKRCKFGIN